MHTYDENYYRYITDGSLRSAEIVLPLVSRLVAVRSVVDLGAGAGAWLCAWQRLGVADVVGVDGDHVQPTALMIPADRFVAADLAVPVRLRRAFDLVESLEVAEHLPPSAARTFIDNLVAHGDVVLFSAAAPGQGGEYHVNERPYDYWRALFDERGYAMFDPIRIRVVDDLRVEPWYRYNTFLYVNRRLVPSLTEELKRTLIARDQPIRDLSPRLYKIRKSAIRCLPTPVMTQLAVLKKHWSVSRSADA